MKTGISFELHLISLLILSLTLFSNSLNGKTILKNQLKMKTQFTNSSIYYARNGTNKTFISNSSLLYNPIINEERKENKISESQINTKNINSSNEFNAEENKQNNFPTENKKSRKTFEEEFKTHNASENIGKCVKNKISDTPNAKNAEDSISEDGLFLPMKLQKASLSDLISNPEQPKTRCSDEDSASPAKSMINSLLPYEGYSSADGPQPKPNPYRIMDSEAFSHINYLFDYLDEFFIAKENKTFLKIVVEEYKKFFDFAMSLPKFHKDEADPYTPKKLLFFYSGGKATYDDAVINEDQVIAQIKLLNKNFDGKVFKKSVSVTQLFHLLSKWRWTPGAEDVGVSDVKRILDKFDFDGDGRLNPVELIILGLKFPSEETPILMEFCYKQLLEKILDPLFIYLDCERKGFISAENMWNGLKNIKRNSDKFNLYSCIFKRAINKNYRTNSFNDFILRIAKDKKSYLSLNEFRTGILVGYWERQVTALEISDCPDSAQVEKRWGNNGMQDFFCDKVKRLVPKDYSGYRIGFMGEYFK